MVMVCTVDSYPLRITETVNNASVFHIISTLTDKELFEKNVYVFTGTSDLATYLNSATASHYLSAHRHIQKWWKQQQ